MPEGRNNAWVDLFGDEATDFRWMTYGELGRARGISVTSARNLAYRRNWRRQPGNDGTIRVAVPLDETERRNRNAAVEDGVHELEAAVTQLRSELARERLRADAATEAAACSSAQLAQATAQVEKLQSVASLAKLLKVSLERALTAEEAARDRTETALERAELALADAQAEAAALRQAERERRGQGRFDRIKAAWQGK